jgi:hypothetical protein
MVVGLVLILSRVARDRLTLPTLYRRIYGLRRCAFAPFAGLLTRARGDLSSFRDLGVSWTVSRRKGRLLSYGWVRPILPQGLGHVSERGCRTLRKASLLEKSAHGRRGGSARRARSKYLRFKRGMVIVVLVLILSRIARDTLALLTLNRRIDGPRQSAFVRFARSSFFCDRCVSSTVSQRRRLQLGNGLARPFLAHGLGRVRGRAHRTLRTASLLGKPAGRCHGGDTRRGDL